MKISKTRIVETEDGRFMPQFRPGLFWRWRFLKRNADTSDFVRVVLLEERDPAQAAQFVTETEAMAFLDRFESRVARHWQGVSEAEARTHKGVRIKRVV